MLLSIPFCGPNMTVPLTASITTITSTTIPAMMSMYSSAVCPRVFFCNSFALWLDYVVFDEERNHAYEYDRAAYQEEEFNCGLSFRFHFTYPPCIIVWPRKPPNW